ncbi:MAG: malate/lactate/ureidoglycolate dehydrogenase [Betaproteobacteria bacterium]|nr:MAG: malate/lactate/ureidoglycolate dehydrogenase [Betaproteobacteria bacterium]
MTIKIVLLDATKLRDFVKQIFTNAGCSQTESELVARLLVESNLAGHDSHGVIRVPRYVQMMRDQLIFADQKVELLVDAPALALVDGKYGFGQTVALQATEIGIRKCRQTGLSAVALRNAGHIGRVADWAELAAAEGFVSVHFVNGAGSVMVAPFGSYERRFSTAPYCVGVPVPDAPPLILDFATSVVAEGKVLVASQGGKQLRPDALIGPDGKPSNDPHLLYGEYDETSLRDPRVGDGAIRAFGEHKGSGLAMMCEILGGALTGNGCTKPGRRFTNGMFSFYVDPVRVDPDELFPKEVSRYVAFVKQAKPSEPRGHTLVPGDPEVLSKEKRLRDGIPLPENTWQSIVETAVSVGIEEAPAAKATQT